MQPGKTFSVAFCSAWLAVYYRSVLAGSRRNAGALGMLARTFARAPRWIPVRAAAHHGGHCYVIALDEDFLCDRRGRSVLRLYENGVALPAPHTLDVDEIVARGAGRTLHVGRRMYFSPSDNAPLDRNPRTYAILETLTDDPARIQAMLELNAQLPLRSNRAAWAYDKALLLLQGRLEASGSVQSGASGITVYAPALDLRDLGLGQAGAARATIDIEPAEGGLRLAAHLEEARLDALDSSADIRLSASTGADGSLRAASFDARFDGGEVSLQWNDDLLTRGRAKLGGLARARAALTEACGGDEACERWLHGFLAALRGGLLTGVELDAACEAAVLEALLPGSARAEMELRLERDPGALRVRAAVA